MTEDTGEAYLDGVQATADYLDAFNEERIQKILLTEENPVLLDTIVAVSEDEMDNGTIIKTLQTSLMAKNNSN